MWKSQWYMSVYKSHKWDDSYVPAHTNTNGFGSVLIKFNNLYFPQVCLLNLKLHKVHFHPQCLRSIESYNYSVFRWLNSNHICKIYILKIIHAFKWLACWNIKPQLYALKLIKLDITFREATIKIFENTGIKQESPPA